MALTNEPSDLPKEKPSQENLNNNITQNPITSVNNDLDKPKLNKKLIISAGVILFLIGGIIIWAYFKGPNQPAKISTNNTSSTKATSGSSSNQSSANNSSSSQSSQSASSSQSTSIPAAINAINPAAIPLGTGKVSSSPEIGYVDFCNNRNVTTAPEPVVPWINTSNSTWDSLTKPSVEGSVSWSSSAYYKETLSGNTRTISFNDLPINHDTGIFPISKSDPAYQYDHNPNTITAQPTNWQLPANPTAATTPSCTNDGPVGVLTDGVYIFNALDADDRDAGATEILDQWQGHPDSGGMYHHHTAPNFMVSAAPKSTSTLIGYAIDGYGIYIEKDANGNLLTNANLDACHGRTSEVMWNGQMTDIYHYDATLEYPYTVGCFHGTPIETNMTMNMSGPSSPPAKKP